MSRSILVGFDGRDHAADALALGHLLAAATGASLLAACAYPEDPLGETGQAVGGQSVAHHEADRALARAREQFAALPAGAHTVALDCRAVAGEAPATVLHRLAEAEQAALIVVGATHHGAAIRLLTGSTPERVLDGAPCPVAIAPEGYADRLPHGGRPLQVAVAYNNSPEAREALDAAVAFARTAGARLRVITAVNGSIGLYPPLDPTAYAEIAELARTTAREQLAAAVAGLDDLAVETAILDGDPSSALLDDAEDDDLLFTGSSGKGPFRRVLLGSVSTTLLRASACPVVIIPRGSGEGAAS